METVVLTQVFLSHSSKDKPAVRRLKNELETRGLSIWMDETDIDPGSRFIDGIEKGLVDSDVICIWMTPNSVRSKWVEAEWKERITREIETGKVSIIPLLADDCKIPYWLKSRNYIDFRHNYEDAIIKLFSRISEITKLPKRSRYIVETTFDFLSDLSDISIEFPLNSPTPIIETLKKMPRSGKNIRLHSFVPSLKIRTIYEHILSVAYSADCLLDVCDNNIEWKDAAEISRIIAYHELNEIIIGDMPAYTPLSGPKRARAHLVSERKLYGIDKKVRETVTNEFISMFLDERGRLALNSVNSLMANPNASYKFFTVLDKIDPIIAIWRYLYRYRKELTSAKASRAFLKFTKDFFENPGVKQSVLENSRDLRLVSLVESFQDSILALSYCEDKEFFDNTKNDFGFDLGIIRELIEGFDTSLPENATI